jgi:penicillin-binding protein 1A
MKKKVLSAGLVVFTSCVSLILLWAILVLTNLPDVSILRHYRPAAAAEVIDRDGNIFAQYYDHKFRIWAPISSLPDTVIQAVVTAEDDTFFGHQGVNYKATWDAFVLDVKKQRFARGGSTITQQMIKNVFLSREKTLGRKLREFILAREAEKILTKHQILEIYLNEVEWGEDIYGIEAASRYYLDKHASELNAPEAALIAGMLPNPRYFNPFKRMEKARGRQERVLFNMFQAKLLTEGEYRSALESPIKLRNESSGRFVFSALIAGNGKTCYQKVLESVLLSEYGEIGLYRQGLKIRTTLDKKLQQQLTAWVDQGKDKEAGKETGPYIPESVMVVSEDNEIRAIVCSSNEEEVRFKLDSLGPPFDGYDISSVFPDSISVSEVVRTAGDGSNDDEMRGTKDEGR